MLKLEKVPPSLQVAFEFYKIKKQQAVQNPPSEDDEETQMHQKNHSISGARSISKDRARNKLLFYFALPQNLGRPCQGQILMIWCSIWNSLFLSFRQ